jgi:hypothetical protein
MVQTPVVVELKVGVKPESALAVKVGDEPKLWAPGFVKVMVCDAIGVTLLDAPEAALTPAELVAVTLKL